MLDRAIAAIARAFLLDPAELLDRHGFRYASAARQALYLLLHERHGWAPYRIGRRLGRDHSTILHGLERARDFIAQDQTFAARYRRAAR